MHNAAFRHLGIEASYQAWDIPPAELAAAVARLREPGVYGANVTIPHKLEVMPFLDEVSKVAKTIGAVNTIVNRQGRLLGTNTDAVGFSRALGDVGVRPAGISAVMLGAGGAARAVAYALLTAGVRLLLVYNRTPARAERLARDFAALGAIAVVPTSELPICIGAADLLVNTTSVGMVGSKGDDLPLPELWLPRQGVVVDIIYRPSRTRLLREAQAAGLTIQNGLPMLVYQGAESFSLWTGEQSPARAMLEAARLVLESLPS